MVAGWWSDLATVDLLHHVDIARPIEQSLTRQVKAMKTKESWTDRAAEKDTAQPFQPAA